MSGFFGELRRRNVVKVGVAYAIVAWLIAQIISLIKEPLHLPPWFDTAVIVLLIVGFPIALLLAWAYEMTPQGIKRTAEADAMAAAEAEDAEPVAPALPTAAEERDQSIAVLPFVDMSSDKDQEYFADGISEELLNQLARIRDLHVAGRTSSFSFKGKDDDLRTIGQKLKVAHVLEGSVRKSGNRVRVTAQLIKAADDVHLWTESYDSELDDIFAIQDEIAHAVSDALSITLGVGDLGVSTRSVEAYDAFLEGRANLHRGGREGSLQAARHLERATRLDPDFVEAWSLLALNAFYAAAVFVSDRQAEFLRQHESAANRAVALDSEAVGALQVNALLETRRFNWSAAEQLLTRAVQLAPNNADVLQLLGQLMIDVGRLNEAVGYILEAAEREPLSMTVAQVCVTALEFAGNFETSAREVERARQLDGDFSQVAGPALALALTVGDRAEIEAASGVAIEQDLLPPQNKAMTRTMLEHLDAPENALSALRGFLSDPDYANPFAQAVMGFWASYYGDDELALELWQELLLSRSFPPRVVWRPIHSNMRKLPGFKKLLRELKLVDYWHETGHWADSVRPVGDDDFECV